MYIPPMHLPEINIIDANSVKHVLKLEKVMIYKQLAALRCLASEYKLDTYVKTQHIVLDQSIMLIDNVIDRLFGDDVHKTEEWQEKSLLTWYDDLTSYKPTPFATKATIPNSITIPLPPGVNFEAPKAHEHL